MAKLNTQAGIDWTACELIEQIPGGAGIVLDDMGAGVYAALVLFLMGWFNLY